ncbi:MAG: nucleotide exchange factor GrpE [Ruminococcaceae bacterium]|nr:nucleotide exchange factor GrpE [Oscillospiraceae bacterium]
MSEDIKKETAENEEVSKPEEKAEAPKKEKKTRKNGEVEKLKAELEQKNDLLLRTAAEFDNFRKRTEREKAATAEYAKASVMKTLLPILDNADRATEFEQGTEQYNKGIELIVKQLADLSSKLGLEQIGSVGETFDPTIHEAIMHIEDENLGENTVAQVLQKGYKLGDTVVRPAMVQVAN